MGRNKGNPEWAEDWQEQFLEKVRVDLRALESISKDKGMPHKDTIYKALKADQNFSDDYARAREMRGDHQVEEAMEIAKSATPETVQVARLQVDTKKWVAARMAPRVYGDRVDHTSSDRSMTPVFNTIYETKPEK